MSSDSKFATVRSLDRINLRLAGQTFFAARFGYRFVFANHSGLQALVAKHAARSPTIRFDVVPDIDDGEFNFMQMVFGPRPQKPKWRSREGR